MKRRISLIFLAGFLYIELENLAISNTLLSIKPRNLLRVRLKWLYMCFERQFQHFDLSKHTIKCTLASIKLANCPPRVLHHLICMKASFNFSKKFVLESSFSESAVMSIACFSFLSKFSESECNNLPILSMFASG